MKHAHLVYDVVSEEFVVWKFSGGKNIFCPKHMLNNVVVTKFFYTLSEKESISVSLNSFHAHFDS